MQEGEEVAGGFFMACRDAAALLEPSEQPFDAIAFPRQFLVVGSLNFAIALGRDHGLASLIADPLKHPVAVVALVGNHVFRRESLQQRRGLSDVVRLTGGEYESHRITETVAGRAMQMPMKAAALVMASLR